MENLVVYAVSDTKADAVVLIAKEAARGISAQLELNRFDHMSEPEDLDRLMVLLEEEKRRILLVTQFRSIVSKQKIEQFCRDRGIKHLDGLAAFSFALEELLVEKRFLPDPDDQQISLHEPMNPMAFASRYDDGKNPDGILEADVVLIGISRTSKTPVAVYLANRNLRVANIPLVPESKLPDQLFQVPGHRVFGLSSTSEHLSELRKERLKSLGLPLTADYASTDRIQYEIQFAEQIMKRIGCPIIDVSSKAIEETADIIIRHLHDHNTAMFVKDERRKKA